MTSGSSIERPAGQAYHFPASIPTPSRARRPVDHGGVQIGTGVRISGEQPSSVLVHTPSGRVFEVDLVADAVPERHGRGLPERLLAPLQELVALFVALVFEELNVAGANTSGVPIKSRQSPVVDDQISTSTSGLIFCRGSLR